MCFGWLRIIHTDKKNTCCRNMSLIPAIHSWNLTNYARRLNLNSISKNEFFWSCLDSNQTSLKMTITPALQLMIVSSEQCIEELLGNQSFIRFVKMKILS